MSPGRLLFLAAISNVVALASAHRIRRLWVATTMISSAAALLAAGLVLADGHTWEWRSNFLVGGQLVHLRLDAVSAFFLALLAVLGGAGGGYAQEYWDDAAH